MNISKHIKEHLSMKMPRSGGFADRSQTLLPFGDSITATMWHQFTLTGNITTTAGVSTVSLSGTLNAPIGTKVRLIGFAFAGFNAVHTVTATPSSSSFSFVAPDGAPASEATTGGQYAYFENDQSFQINYVQALKMYSKGRFYIPYNGGVGGNTVAQALARVGESVAACQTYNVGRVVILLGANDALNAVDSDVTAELANMELICRAFLDVGVAVDLCTMMPFGAGYADVANTTKVSWISNFNRGLRKYAKNTNGVNLHDVYSWITDPAQADGRAKANYLGSDGIHPSNVSRSSAAFVIGKNMAANYASWLGPAQDRLPQSQADGQTFSALSKNKWTNHFFLDVSPVNGTADGWTLLYTGGGNSQVATCVARTVGADGDDFGNNQVLTLTAVVGGTNLVYRDPTAAMTVGKTYIARGVCTLTHDTITSLQAEINLSFTTDGIVRTAKQGQAFMPEDGAFVFETPPFIFPTGTSAISFYLRVVTAGTGAPVIKWARVDLEQVD